MRIVGIVLLVMVLLFGAVFAIGGMMQDKHFAFERSILIAAPAASVHPLVGDFDQWERWARWSAPETPVDVTPGAKTTGVGASQSWSAEGGGIELTFTQSEPATGVAYDAAMFAGSNRIPMQGAIRYEPAEGGTRVTWSMEGTIDKPIVGGYIASTMEPRFAPLFEEGLKKLKTAAESAAETERVPPAKED